MPGLDIEVFSSIYFFQLLCAQMDHIRTFIFLVFYYALILIYGVLCVFVTLLPRSWQNIFVVSWTRMVMFFARVILRIKIEIVGRENIPDSPCVVLSNHQSELETYVLQTLFQPLSTILKQELLRLPFFGWGLKMLEPIAIDRSNQRQALKEVQLQGKQRLASGRSVLIFPEGTRVAKGERKKYAKSGASLAVDAQVPIVPVAHNTGDYWANGNRLKRSGTIRFVIGEKIDTESDYEKVNAKLLTENVQNWIELQNA